MSDLFDQVAMRVQGSASSLRLRRRTRFEPVAAATFTQTYATAPLDEAAPAAPDDPFGLPHSTPATTTTTSRHAAPDAAPTTAFDDPLAAGALPPRQSAPQTPRESDRPTASPPAIPTAEPQALPPPHATLSLRDPRATAPHAKTGSVVRPDPVAAPLPDAFAPPPGQTPSRGALASVSTAAPSPAASHTTPPAAIAVALPASAPLSRARPPEQIDTTGYRESAIAHRSDLAVPASPHDAAPGPVAATSFPPDPLGVQTRSRIELQSGTPATARPAPAPAPAPIEVTIGRLEIRGDAAPAARPAKPFAPHLDLAGYRSRRDRGL